MRHALPLSSALFCTLIAGCPGPSTGNVPLEELPEMLAPSYCNLLDRCGNPFAEQFLALGGSCVDGVVPLLEDSFISRAEAAVAAGTVIYHSDRVGTCLSAFEAASCDVTRAADACTDVFEGTIAAGSACGWDEECIDGYCAMTDGTCPGTCASRSTAGGSCTDGRACPTGYGCTDGNCVELAGLGDACGGMTGEGCNGIDLTCVGATMMTAGTCQTWTTALSGAVGSSCDIAVADYCDPGLSCMYAGASGGMPTYTCVAEIASGGDCSIGFPDPCSDTEQCAISGGLMGTCSALPSTGQPCTGTCGTGLRCVASGGSGSTCVAPRRLGEACTMAGECVSGTCSDGVCASPGC